MSAPELTLLRLCDEIAAAIACCEHAITQRLHPPAVSELKVIPPLLADVWPATAVNGVRLALVRVQRHLLRMVISEEAIAPERACRLLQHLYADSAVEWAPRVRRLAEDLGYTLMRSPRDVTNGRALDDV